MRVLLTGATGFVGRAVGHELLSRGHELVALVRNPARAEDLQSRGSELVVGQMQDPASYIPVVSRVDAVIHCAQQTSKSRYTRRVINAMHVADEIMTIALAEACMKGGIPLIYTSGALVHSTNSANDWIDEKSPIRPVLLAKGHADMLHKLDEFRAQGLMSTTITPGFVYGPGGIFADMVARLRKKQYRLIGEGVNWWSLVHVDDLAQVYALALEKPDRRDHYFVSDGVPLARRDFLSLATEALGLPMVGKLPIWMARIFLGGPLVEAISANIRMRNDLVRTDLNWEPCHETYAASVKSVLQDMEPSLAMAHAG